MRRTPTCAVAAIAVAVAGLGTAPAASAGLLPIAVADSYGAVHDRLRTVAAPGVLANDLQLGGGFTATLVTDVSHGTLDLDGDGGFQYLPDEYVGSDTFRYRVNGGLLGLSNTATVMITVTNDAPVASPDSYSAVADVEKSIAAPGVLGNDDDGDGDGLTIDVVQEPAHGNLNEAANGSFRYKADAGFAGTDTWRYRASDGLAWSNTVTVTMTVTRPTPTPTPPSTPAPTPKPTPTPSPAPTSTSSPAPTIPPLPTVRPLPTLPSLPTPSPIGTARPTPTQTPGPTQTAAPRPATTSDPSDPPAIVPAGPVDPTGGGASARPGSGSPAPDSPIEPFIVPAAGAGDGLDLDETSVSFGSFEWAVPALVLTVPGILIVIAVVVETVIGLAWLPLARRSLDGDRRRRRPGFAGLSSR